MPFDGAFDQEAPGTDFGVTEALVQQSQDLAFAFVKGLDEGSPILILLSWIAAEGCGNCFGP